MGTQTTRVLDEYNKAFGQNATEEDVYIFQHKVYLSTAKVAKLLRISNHYFSVIFSKEIKHKVHTIHSGRNKWYCLKEVVALHKESVKKGVPVIELCKPVKLKRKKK